MWTLPKGHVEARESTEQAALREVHEETGCWGEIITRLNEISYWFYVGKSKHRKAVTFFLEVNGFGPDPYGGTRTGFSATTEINRNDWEVSYNGPIPGATNAMVLSDKVTINLEIEAVLQSGE